MALREALSMYVLCTCTTHVSYRPGGTLQSAYVIVYQVKRFSVLYKRINVLNKYFELKNSWGADGVPQTRTTC